MDGFLQKMYLVQSEIRLVIETFERARNLTRSDLQICDDTTDVLSRSILTLRTVLDRYSEPSKGQVQIKTECTDIAHLSFEEHTISSNFRGNDDQIDYEPGVLRKINVSQTDVMPLKYECGKQCQNKDGEQEDNEICASGPHEEGVSCSFSLSDPEDELNQSRNVPVTCDKLSTVIDTVKESFSCDHCGQVLKSRRNLKYHHSQHTGTYRFKCTECGKGFNHTMHYKIHVNSHKDTKLYICEQCGKAYQHSGSLKQHVKTCSVPDVDKERFSCTHCAKSYMRKDNLQEHIEIVHQSKFVYQCDNCGETVRCRKSRSRHQAGFCVASEEIKKPAANKREGRVRCPTCGKLFTRKDTLREHIASLHENTYKYECEGCKQMFKTRAAKSNHKRLHCAVFLVLGS